MFEPRRGNARQFLESLLAALLVVLENLQERLPIGQDIYASARRQVPLGEYLHAGKTRSAGLCNRIWIQHRNGGGKVWVVNLLQKVIATAQHSAGLFPKIPSDSRVVISNLYRYVWNSPINFVDPFGEAGIGVSLGGAVEGGLVAVGAGAQGSVGFGGFVDTNNGNPSVGAFPSCGAFWVNNANNMCDLSGPFKTYSVNAAWGWRATTVQVSVGKNAAGKTIMVFNYAAHYLTWQ